MESKVLLPYPPSRPCCPHHHYPPQLFRPWALDQPVHISRGVSIRLSGGSKETNSSDDSCGDDQHDAGSCDEVWEITVNQPLYDGRMDQLDP